MDFGHTRSIPSQNLYVYFIITNLMDWLAKMFRNKKWKICMVAKTNQMNCVIHRVIYKYVGM